MFSIVEKLSLSILLLVCIVSFTWEIVKRFRIVLKGQGDFPFDNISGRLLRVFDEFFLQKKVLQQRFIPGLMHAFVFWGFMFFSIITILFISTNPSIS